MNVLPAFNHAEVILDPETSRFRCAVAWLDRYGLDPVAVEYDAGTQDGEPSLRLLIERTSDKDSFLSNPDGSDFTIRPGVHVDLTMAAPVLTSFSGTGVTFRGKVTGRHRSVETGEYATLTDRDAEIRLSHLADGFPVGAAYRRIGVKREEAGRYGGERGTGHCNGLSEAARTLHELTGVRARSWHA